MSERLQRIQNWEQLAKQASFHPGVMAALCPISLRHLQRFFIKHFQKTPREWARDLKSRLALQMISQGWSTKAVAAELGFADDSHFCHEFKRVHGVSPQTFAPRFDEQQMSRFCKDVALKRVSGFSRMARS
jgi:AraC-like DNA-binding protein